MLKDKYLHRKKRKVSYHRDWDNKKYQRVPKYKYDLSLPKKEPIRKVYNYKSIDFTPLTEFLETKIGYDWNDIYTEIILKTKTKFRYHLEKELSWHVQNPIYDKNFIPRTKYGNLFVGYFYINENNKLSIYKTKEELFLDSTRKKRKEKMLRIIENQEE